MIDRDTVCGCNKLLVWVSFCLTKVGSVFWESRKTSLQDLGDLRELHGSSQKRRFRYETVETQEKQKRFPLLALLAQVFAVEVAS